MTPRSQVNFQIDHRSTSNLGGGIPKKKAAQVSLNGMDKCQDGDRRPAGVSTDEMPNAQAIPNIDQAGNGRLPPASLKRSLALRPGCEQDQNKVIFIRWLKRLSGNYQRNRRH
jgi:hypothetical protein